VLGLCLDEQLGGREPVRSETVDELVGKANCEKRQSVSPVGGRVELPAGREVRWRVTESKRTLVETPRKPVSKIAFGSESCLYRTLIQPGELTQSADPEPTEQVSEHGQAEHFHRELAEPLRRPATRHDHSIARREPGRERPVGDPHPAWWIRGRGASSGGDSRDGNRHRTRDLLDERGLPAEVTGGGAGG
jgi:hypothetical protein